MSYYFKKQMFTRSIESYSHNEELVNRILKDGANPLKQINNLIGNNSKILDIGSGNGILAEILKKTHDNLIIDGIETNKHAAEIAKKFYRNFYYGDFQKIKDKIHNENYDFIVLADVIEHVDNPLSFLQDLRSCVHAKTKIILSIPNVAFGSVRINLMNGRFDYVDSGLLEKTHLRFFTQKTIKNMVREADMNIEKFYFLQRNFLNTDSPSIDINLLSLYQIYKDNLSSVYQFLLVLSLKETSTEKKYFGTKLQHPLRQWMLKKILKRFK